MLKKNWIQGATTHKGALHRHLGIPIEEKIPQALLRATARRKDKVGAEARLAITLGKLRQKKKHSTNPTLGH